MTRAAAAAAGALFLVGAVGLHAAVDQRLPPPSVDRPDLLYIRSPAVARRTALHYDGLAADLYWIRALQLFGHERLSPPGHPRSYALLYPLLDLTTTLDPYFSIAYRFGAIYLGEPYPGGPGRPDLAIELLRKGMAAQPQKWQYMQDLGFVYYWHLSDYKNAASWFERAAGVPGAPNWMRPLAAVTLAEGGNRRASRELWQQLLNSDTEWLRKSAQLRLAQLDAMDHIDVIQSVVARYHAQHPEAPLTWPAMIAAHAIPGVPVDSSNTPFALDASTGRVTVAEGSQLFPLPGQLQPPQ